MASFPQIKREPAQHTDSLLKGGDAINLAGILPKIGGDNMQQYPEKVMFLMKVLEKLNYSRQEIEFLLKNKDIDYLASLYGYDEQLNEE